jgi:hypothetical protein|tara:strand:- start:215 stop:475 length:261 start_codon:yes stop_codon:yes gene_type:complete
MNNKFKKMVREILLEIAQESALQEIDTPASSAADIEGDEMITNAMYDDFMKFIEGLPEDMQLQLINQYQDQLKQQMVDAAEDHEEY